MNETGYAMADCVAYHGGKPVGVLLGREKAVLGDVPIHQAFVVYADGFKNPEPRRQSRASASSEAPTSANLINVS